MTSPTSNEMFTVTHFIPAGNPYPVQHGTSTDQTPSFLQRFIKGEPKALGGVQIIIGFIYVSLGAILCTNYRAPYVVYSGVVFWGALFYFISGGLSISAERNRSLCLVKGSLGMNIVSSIAAGITFIICAIDLSDGQYYYNYNCYYNSYSGYYSTYYGCVYYRNAFWAFRTGLLTVLLIVSMLEFCISIATSSFGCKSACNVDTSQAAQPVFVIQNAYPQDPRFLATQIHGIPVGQGMPMGQGIAMPQGVPMTQGIPMGHPKPPSNGVPMASGIPMAQEVANAPVPPPYVYEEITADDGYSRY